MVEVKVIHPADRIADRQYLMVVYDDHAMIVDYDKGSTRIEPLDGRAAPGSDRSEVVLESAKRKAEAENIPFVYVVDYSPPSRPEDEASLVPK